MNIVYKGPWEHTELCTACGYDLGVSPNWKKPCPGCGQRDKFSPITTNVSKRFVCTEKRMFRRDLGYYEYQTFTQTTDELQYVAQSARALHDIQRVLERTENARINAVHAYARLESMYIELVTERDDLKQKVANYEFENIVRNVL